MKKLVFALLLVAGSTLVAAEQDMVLTGVVTTVDDGQPVPGATVSIDSLRLTATTDAAGRYTIALPAGTATDKLLDVRVKAEGLLPKHWSFRPAASGPRFTCPPPPRPIRPRAPPSPRAPTLSVPMKAPRPCPKSSRARSSCSDTSSRRVAR